MADRINYIKQINAFWDLHGTGGFLKPTSQAVYFSLLQINNICGWKDPFLATYSQVLNMTGIANSKTYYSALEELSRKEFIVWNKSSNQYQAASFSIKVLYQISEEQGKSTVTASTLHGNSPVTIPKQENNKQENNRRDPSDLFFLDGEIESIIKIEERAAAISKKTINVHFEEFWKLYPIKVGKKDSEKKWNNLKDQDREKIIETLPAYIKFEQFPGWNHPQPTTYLNQERWNDVLIPSQQIKSNIQQPKKRVIDHSRT